ncbi:MAG: DNA/RNA non-specific endonuclease [Bacteroidales bacterium]|nr:DNA/RNA non-specific endonuclease [Bacteroidales bacterium]
MSILRNSMVAAVLVASAAAVSCDKLPELLSGISGGEGQESVASVVPRSTSLPAEEGSVWVDVTATGSWSLALEFPDGTPEWAEITPNSGTGKRSDVRLKYQANTGEESRSVTIFLVPDKGSSATVEVVQQGAGGGGQVPAGQYGYDVAPASLDWLELPAAVAGDGREILIHNMEGGKYKSERADGTRNFSCYWDYDDYMSLWVAYPLNNSLKGSGGRSDMWGFDALLPASIQPDLRNGSYGGGWTRGHQLPSADRLRTVAANASTFVPTNLTPQNWDFNGGIWVDLENRVRDYAAKSDTLYVVTGALFDSSSQYSGSNSGFRVKIPTHYFKALLYNGSSTYATNGYMAAGYIFPHSSGIAGDNYLDYIMSIDELEQQTGIDFFPNLAGIIGKEAADRIEAAAPSSWWK